MNGKVMVKVWVGSRMPLVFIGFFLCKESGFPSPCVHGPCDLSKYPRVVFCVREPVSDK